MTSLFKNNEWLSGILLLWVAGLPAAEEAGSALAERLLETLEEQASSSNARVVAFQEYRRFPFRSKPVELSGMARIDIERGTSVEYPEKKVAIIVDDEGMMMRRFGSDGSFKDRALPAREGETGELLSALFRFDKQALLEQFNVEATRQEEQWSLVLHPKGGDVSKLEAVEILGDAMSIRSIDIRLKGDKGFRIEPQEETELGFFSEEDLSRYFR